MAMRWSMWVATVPPPRGAALAVHDQVVALDLDRDAVRRAGRRRRRRGGRIPSRAAPSARASRVVPSAKVAATARIGIFVDHRRRALGRHVDAAQRRRAHAEIGHLLAARRCARSSVSMSAPISRSVVISPVRSGLVMTSVEDDLGARHDQRGDHREGGRGRIGRHHRPAPARAPAGPSSVILRPCAPSGSTATSAPKWREQPLGVVAARFALDHGGLARRGEARQQHRRFDLRRRHRRAIDDRDRIARAVERDRQPAALGHAHRARADQRRPDRGCASSAACAGEASPSKVAVIGQPATTPIISRQPVPELPKSSTPAARAKPPTPTPCTRQRPRRCARPRRPAPRMALPVLSTSSPSSRPEMRVSPTASAPKISARCEIDLSPGTRTRPLSGPARRAAAEMAAAWFTATSAGQAVLACEASGRHGRASSGRAGRKPARDRAFGAIDRAIATSQVKHLKFRTRLKEPGPWQSLSSAPNACAATAP